MPIAGQTEGVESLEMIGDFSIESGAWKGADKDGDGDITTVA